MKRPELEKNGSFKHLNDYIRAMREYADKLEQENTAYRISLENEKLKSKALIRELLKSIINGYGITNNELENMITDCYKVMEQGNE